jgi:hypothetical protein
VDEEPTPDGTDVADAPAAAEYRERLERARTHARRRYHEHLAAALQQYGATDPDVLADLALDALTVWRYVDSGERCRCACHPRLPETDLHDYGFGCVCAQTPQQRRRGFDEWRKSIKAFWNSPDGVRIAEAERAADAALETWLAGQRGVVVHSHGGLAPEQMARSSRRTRLLLSRTPFRVAY